MRYSLKALAGVSVKLWILCLKDYTIGAVGALFGVAGNTLMGLAKTNLQLWLGKVTIIAKSLGDINVPGIMLIFTFIL